ncbi:MAG: helix-turn-helix transcriptional regulator [Holophagales bacterium]|nr:helix-turn-helix transcriptional regulator [Holophagales bacterium]MYA08564.1 helix-turn-helix transcriptional regulator [Holophagales bacterium]MYD22869.1 helix-turn-helix transcriptional regulator [Holophagales bacterium]MYG32095.1 helix-turn-helix transcriptional regulator [Holophagales bacterium]MYI32157.1 helix-turn-helix transcriptional regulator [Holophagales bacterium]
MAGEGPEESVRVHMVGLYYRGQRREDLEREYVETYHAIDECVARFRRQPYGRLVRIPDLYSRDELKTSEAFNEFYSRTTSQNGLIVRLEGPVGYSHFTWAMCDPIGRGGVWSSSQIEMIRRVAPHVRQLVFVRQALADAGALGSSLAELRRRAAALILIVDPWLPLSVSVDHLAAVLGLTRAESEVASWLAEGKTVGEIAAATGRQKRSIYWHLEQIYAKLGVRRQVDLVRVVLAAAECV